MGDLPGASLGILHRQLGVISAAQLRNTGVSDRSRRRLLATGVIEPAGRSVYRVPDIPLTFQSRLVMLSLQHRRGFITGPTAGGLVGLRRMPRASRVHFCVPHGLHVDVGNHVQLRQSNYIAPHHVRRLDNGIAIADWGRLAFDLSADLAHTDLASALEQMLQWQVVETTDLVDIARELCGRGRPGSRQFARVLVERHPGPAAESHPELRVLDGLRRCGVPVVPQVAGLQLPNGSSIRIDMAVPEVRWAVEVDVHPDHLDLVGTTRDKRRDRQLHLIGWQVERVTRLDLLDLRRTLDELVELYEVRRADVEREGSDATW